MAKGVESRSQVLETEYESGTTHLIGAVVMLVVSLFLLYGAKVIIRQGFSQTSLQVVYLRPFLFLTGLVGVVASLVRSAMAALC